MRRSDDGYYYVNYLVTKGLCEISRVTQTVAEPMPFLNENQIPSVHDGNIRTAGESYLAVLMESRHTAEIHFDNLVVEKIE